MFCDFGVKTCNKFLSNTEFRELTTKNDRIRYVLARFDMDHLCRASVETILEHSRKGRKSSEVADHHLKCAETLYLCTSNTKEQLHKAVKNANKALLNADFGGQTFVEALQLRAKCFVKMEEYEQALVDLEVAGAYDGFSAERALLKAICLHSKNRFKPLKDLLRPIKSSLESFNDAPLLEELGKSNLSVAYLYSFISDPNFGNRTSRPTDLLSNPPVLHYIESLTSYKAIYELDSRCKIQNDEYKGRHFVAEEPISKGTTVLIERTYSLALDSQSQFERCLFCHKTCLAFIPCKFCTEVVFCSESCSEHAWKLFHQHECTLLSLFKDSFNVSLHMYRAISMIGVKGALAVEANYQERVKKCMEKLEAHEEGEASTKKAKSLVKEEIITDFLRDDILRKTATFQQSEEQLQKMYLMNQALLDHNDMYEDYYDTCYMGVSIDVALLLFIEMMVSENGKESSDSGELAWDQLQSVQLSRLKGLGANVPFLSGTVGEFMQLIAIVQMNIRKLVTNVFSWNIYDDAYQVKRSVGTCQCLVGSLINHSCDPNIEWDFKNGCIVYTALRNIEQGEEINNSYGPHSSTPFIDRQNLLSSNYYFNCRCDLCQKQVANHPHVLACPQCEGPVVCLSEVVIPATCMDCLAEYPEVQYRMKRVNQSRVKFKNLMHFFHDQPYGGGINDELASHFTELIETMEYQITYSYRKGAQLQRNLQVFCRLLARLGKQDQACHYGQYQTLEESQFKSSDKTATVLAKLENSIFWFQMYCNYLAQYGENKRRGDSALLAIAKNLLTHHFGVVQKATVKLAKCYDLKPSNAGENEAGEEGIDEEQPEEDEEEEDEELDAQDLLDASGESDGEDGSLVPSVKRLLSDIAQLCSAQYSNQSIGEH